MKYALALAAVSAAWLIPVAGRAVWRHFKQTQSTFDRLVDEAAPPKLTLVPTLEFVPDGFTCQGCGENPALPSQVWCAVCLPLSHRHFRSEPIDRSTK